MRSVFRALKHGKANFWVRCAFASLLWTSFARTIIYKGNSFEKMITIRTEEKELGDLSNVSHSDSTTVASMILHPRDGWYPSEEWVHNCTQDLSSRTEAEGEWDIPHDIALGDCIKFCRCYHGSLPNTTFNKLYHKRACHGGPLSAGNGRFNLSIIDEVHAIQGKNPSLFMKPEPEALVIHLRLGDIVETSKSTVEQMLISGANPGYKPRNFQKGLKSIHEVLDNIHSSNATIVHIVGGSHKKHFWKKSRVYAGCLHRAIQTAGHNVTMRLEGTHPDVDFYYISHASQVVVSAGGYSNLMGKLAEHRGGRIVGRSFGVSW